MIDARAYRIAVAAGVACWLVVIAVVVAEEPATPAAPPAASGGPFVADVVPLLSDHCYDCHNDKKAKGEVNLARFATAESLAERPELWQTVMRVVREREMPPKKPEDLNAGDRDRIVGAIDQTLRGLHYEADPGRTVMRRLTRAEYNNTVRDLFGITWDATSGGPADAFPPDGGGEGFDNFAATLYMPPILLEKALIAGRQVAEQVTPSTLFDAKPDEKLDDRAKAERILRRLIPRAFRRPMREGELERHLALYDRCVKEAVDAEGKPNASGDAAVPPPAPPGGRGVDRFDASIRRVIQALLVSPHFLYRIERERPDATGPYKVSDHELATRLSYFLWSSMPDDALFAAADAGKLHEPAELAKQVARMLADPKSRAFAERFVTQWLDISTIERVEPDAGRYPTYNPALRSAMVDEVVTFFHAMVREGRPLGELVDADYTYVNAALAKHYGIDGVEGEAMRRVELGDGSPRGGVMTMAAVLTVTAYPQRTSPVLRGKWVLEQMLGVRTPPPPDSVKVLDREDKPRDGLTFRQRLEKHREDPSCAGCHDKIDPLGYGLEGFDSIGAFRDKIGGSAIDTSGQMPSGEKFSGPSELKKIVLRRKGEVARHLTEKLLAYALGRGVEAYDTPVVNGIMDAAGRDGDSARALVTAVVTSYPFTHRKNAPGGPGGDESPPASEVNR